MGIKLVLRGEDHVSNTATQVQMFGALGAEPPQFAHEALLVGSEGKLSKRLGSLGVSAFREQGIEAISLIALLARIGTSEPVIPVAEPAPLIESFDFAHFGRAPARFDEAELRLLNQKIVHMLDFATVRDRLPDRMGETGWLAIRPNLEIVADAADWWRIVTGPIERTEQEPEDRAFLALAAAALAGLPFEGDVWHALTNALKAETDRKGRALFLPLRRALTGRDHGPDMAALLPLVGREEALVRLSAAAKT